jgi:hypothetical protein
MTKISSQIKLGSTTILKKGVAEMRIVMHLLKDEDIVYNVYKEAGLATYGDWAVLNRRYLAIIAIRNLKDWNQQKQA